MDVLHPSGCHREVSEACVQMQEVHRWSLQLRSKTSEFILLFLIFTGCSIITQWLSSGISSSASTSRCRRIRSVAATRHESSETFSPRNSIISTSSSSKGGPILPILHVHLLFKSLFLKRMRCTRHWWIESTLFPQVPPGSVSSWASSSDGLGLDRYHTVSLQLDVCRRHLR